MKIRTAVAVDRNAGVGSECGDASQSRVGLANKLPATKTAASAGAVEGGAGPGSGYAKISPSSANNLTRALILDENGAKKLKKWRLGGRSNR